MSLSVERQAHLARLLVDGLWNDDIVDYTDDDRALKCAKQAMTAFVAELEAIDQFARDRVNSLKRGVLEGSPEWDVLYSKYIQEEMKRRGN